MHNKAFQILKKQKHNPQVTKAYICVLLLNGSFKRSGTDLKKLEAHLAIDIALIFSSNANNNYVQCVM